MIIESSLLDLVPNTPAFEIATLVDVLRWRAAQQPERSAYTFLVDGEAEAVSLTYKELDEQARAIGALLQGMVPEGARALLLYPPGLDYLTAFFGCLYAGVIAVPAYPPHPVRLARTFPRIQAIVADAHPAIVLTTSSILVSIEGFFAQMPDFRAMRWLATDTVSDQLAAEWRDSNISADTLAFLQYTSGSTSTPKGVMVSHGNLMYNERMVKCGFGHTEESTFVGWLPLYHDMGLIGNVLQPLYIGARCILMSPMAFLQKPARWLQAITTYQAHTSGGPNFAYDLCVRKITPEQIQSLDLRSWKVAFNGAEPVRSDTLDRFAATFAPCGLGPEALYPCYGLAEATLFVSGGVQTELPVVWTVQSTALEQNRVVAAAPIDADSKSIVGCGRTWLDQQIVIVDPETRVVCPEDQVGEIWVSGPNIPEGYWNRPQETAHTFQASLADTGQGPFLRTGDLGFLQAGELFVTGRLKDLIVIDGRNHYPQDIEHTVEQCHPALRAGCCAAFSVDSDNQEQLVVVAEVDRQHRPRAGDSASSPGLDIEAVKRAIQRAIAEQHDLQVASIALLKIGGMPKTSSGKIQRRACRASFLAATLDVWGV